MEQNDSRPSAAMPIKEFSDEMGISINLAYQLAREGRIPTIRLGRRIVIPRVAFDRWLNGESEG